MNVKNALVIGIAVVLTAFVHVIIPSLSENSKMLCYQRVPLHDAEVALLDTLTGQVYLGQLTPLHGRWLEKTPAFIKRERGDKK